MIGAHKKATTLAFASLIAGAFALTPATAADLGGDCCADLEERVAELEATTARKGNRKVSLTVSGQVNTALLIWDDGEETDVFIVDNENSNTRFRFKGDAKVKPGWTAGFLIELDIDGHANSSSVSNAKFVEKGADSFFVEDDDGASGVQGDILELRHADLFVKSPYGKVSLGQGNTASNGTSEVDLSGTSVAGYSGTSDIGANFAFTPLLFDVVAGEGKDLTVRKGDVQTNLDGLSRDNRIRYDSPSLAGFIFSASYGEDDQYDVALRYKNKLGDFNLAAAISYSNQQEDEVGGAFEIGDTEESEIINGSISALHIPTGLNFTFAAGDRDRDLVGGGEAASEQTFYYGKVGIKRKISSLGSTALSFDYGFYDEFAGVGTESEHFGIQLVQKVDAAAMELYFAYSHDTFEDDLSDVDSEDLDFFMLGSRIKF